MVMRLQVFNIYLNHVDKKVIFETEEFVVEEIVGDEDQIFRRVVHKSNLDQT